MKLIVQIPCFNEERTIRQSITDVRRAIPGVDSVEVLVIDTCPRLGAIRIWSR